MSFAPPTGSRRFAKSYKDSCTGQADGVRSAIRETARQRRLHGGRVEEAAASGELGELIETAQRFQRENETLRALLRRVKVESGAAIADLAATVSRLESDRDALRLERDECRAEARLSRVRIAELEVHQDAVARRLAETIAASSRDGAARPPPPPAAADAAGDAAADAGDAAAASPRAALDFEDAATRSDSGSRTPGAAGRWASETVQSRRRIRDRADRNDEPVAFAHHTSKLDMTNASPMKHEEYAGERARGSWILRPDSVANVKCTGVDANFFASLREGAPDFSTSPKKAGPRGSYASPARPTRPPPQLASEALTEMEKVAMFLPEEEPV